MTQAEQLAAQAAQWQAAGRADMAVQLYGAALEQDPSKFAIRMQLAECLAMLGQTEPAAEQYLMVAQAYAARGRQQECLAICDRLLALAPHAFVYMSVGPMVRRIGRHARPICARAAEAHLAAGRLTDGLQMLRLGAELDPHNPDVRRQLARIYQARHMKREAVEALTDAGNLLLQAKRYEDYVQVAEQILALEPRDLETLRDLPRVYLELQKPHDAVRMLGLLTKVSPGDIVGYEILAQAFALIGRNDKSLSVLERLVEELAATGQADKADAILNHARHWRPTDIGYLRSLKRMEVPRAKPQALHAAGVREAAPEGTVVLSIADLLVDEVSRRAPSPDREGVELTEAEGTLTLRLDELMLDELQQASDGRVARTRAPAPSPPPPPSKAASADKRARPGQPAPPARPGPSPRRVVEAPVEATMALDASDLLEALTGEHRPRAAAADPPVQAPPRAEPRDHATLVLDTNGRYALEEPPEPENAPATIAVTLRPHVDEDVTTAPPPGRAAGRSISELIYDDDDADADAEEPEPETLLHMKALTPADIARALAKQASQAPQQAAPQQAALPVTPAPAAVPPAVGLGDEAPTIARLTPLTAADIARALSRGTPTRPPPGPVSDDAVTLPPPGRSPASTTPEEPPLLTPAPVTPVLHRAPNEDGEDGDDDDGSTLSMEVLRPEDLLHGPTGGPTGDPRRR